MLRYFYRPRYCSCEEDQQEQNEFLEIFKNLSPNQQVNLMCLVPILRAYGSESSPYNSYQYRDANNLIKNRPPNNLADNSNFCQLIEPFKDNPFIFKFNLN